MLLTYSKIHKMHSIIYMFTQDDIEIPPLFVETWQLDLDDQKHG